MNRSVSRFGRPSSPLEMKALLRGARRAVWAALLVALGVHLSLTGIAGSEAEQKAAKPLTTQFVKRQPWLTKPLEPKKRPRPARHVAAGNGKKAQPPGPVPRDRTLDSIENPGTV